MLLVTHGTSMVAEQPIVHHVLGASLVKFRPVLSNDSKNLFCCCGHIVKVYSTSSGECVQELRSHRKLVTSIKTNPRNHLQIFTASLDKTIAQWDYLDGIALKKYHLTFPIYGLLAPGFQDSNLLAVRQSSKTGYDIVKFHLPKSESASISPNVLLHAVSSEENCVAIGAKNEFVAAVKGRKLKVYLFNKKSTVEHLCSFEPEKLFTCVTCHPTDLCIATGCSDGKIILWFNFFGKEKVVKTIKHWHALPVGCLAFTKEGSYMLSGGRECVLVKWQYNSQHRDTLPRLGAPINHVTCSHDNQMYVTCHTDNTIHLIANNFKTLQIFQGLTRGHHNSQLKNPIPAGLLTDPRTKALVLNGKPGHLQFYSLRSDRQLYNLDIVCQNYISPENLKRPLVITEVENSAFSSDGDWLATVECRNDGVTAMELRLKFWLFDKSKQMYILNTSVDLPHRQQVNSIKFRPVSGESENGIPMAVTASGDGKFKSWLLVNDTDIYRANQCWTCESVGYYRDLPAGDVAFSEDGSLLAVIFDSVITLWNPDVNALQTTLCLGQDRIRHIVFCRGQCSHFLASGSERSLTVWNLLSCSVQWSLPMDVVILCDDPFSENMAAFTYEKKLFVFKPSNPEPVFSQQKVSRTPIMSAIFVPNSSPNNNNTLEWQKQSRLYYMNHEQELLTLSLKEELDTSNVLKLNIGQNLPETPLSILMSERRKKGLVGNKEFATQGMIGQPGLQAVRELLSTPAHVLPPVSSLCGMFVKALLIPKKSTGSLETLARHDHQEDEEIESQPGSDSESDMDIDDEHRKPSNNIRYRQSRSEADTERTNGNQSTVNNVEAIKNEDFSWLSKLFS